MPSNLTSGFAGGGLDIDGWSYLKQENGRNVNDLTDKSYVHRQMQPLLVKTNLRPEEYKDVRDIVIQTLETKSVIDAPWIAETLKKGLDKAFGASWHVVVGEEFTFHIDFEDRFFYYILYGNVAIVAWKCGAMMHSEINHIGDPETREKMKKMLLGPTGIAGKKGKGKLKVEKKVNLRDYFSDRI